MAFKFDPDKDQIAACAPDSHIILDADEATIWRDSLMRCLLQRELHLEAKAMKPESAQEA
jgi:hypothetical protein